MSRKNIRVAMSTRHGMADEISQCPPDGVEYVFPEPSRSTHRLIRSPLKCYLWEFEQSDDFDLIEAILSPVITDMPWICSLDCFPAAVAYNLRGVPIPRSWRVAYISRLLRRENCRKIIFWSEAARRTMLEYGGIDDPRIIDKTTVVYPAIREVPAERIQFREEARNLLFSGDFFRKGGANVVDVFESLQDDYPELTLRVCCDPKIDFNTPNQALRKEYLSRIESNPRIELGRVPRSKMLEEILPATDIYLLPTYNEAFGFAILEAMAYGIPVVCTNVFAIPEIISDGVDGLLVDVSAFDMESIASGYVVNNIPRNLRESINSQMRSHVCGLLESRDLRWRIAERGLETAQVEFGFKRRNRTIQEIYKG